MGGGVKNSALAADPGRGARARSVEVVDDPDVTPRGAAMLAGIGIGLFSDFERCRRAVRAPDEGRSSPTPRNARLYERHLRRRIRAAPGLTRVGQSPAGAPRRDRRIAVTDARSLPDRRRRDRGGQADHSSGRLDRRRPRLQRRPPAARRWAGGRGMCMSTCQGGCASSPSAGSRRSSPGSAPRWRSAPSMYVELLQPTSPSGIFYEWLTDAR